MVLAHDALQASPEFKGIKTVRIDQVRVGQMLQASPEFKGIKTLAPASFRISFGFKPALNSKGLRLGCSSHIAAVHVLQASPEFKGIKTVGAFLDEVGQGRFKSALNSKKSGEGEDVRCMRVRGK